jgi:hypothetical protein
MKNSVFIAGLVFLMVSCKNKEEIVAVDRNGKQKEMPSLAENALDDKETKEEEIISIPEAAVITNNDYKPTHMVYKNAGPGGGLIPVYAADDVNSRALGYIDLGETVEVIAVGGNSMINNENASWYTIRNRKYSAGWCTSNYFVDITEMDLSQLAMNKINIQELIISNQQGEDTVIKITGKDGNFLYKYGVNSVFVGFYNKTEEFDDDFMYSFKYYPRVYSVMEVNMHNGVEDFPILYFNRNRRKNYKNGILFFDSFCFAPHDVGSKELSRRIYFSTNTYNGLV